MINMPLSTAAKVLGARLIGPDQDFVGCSIDSRQIEPGQLFIALKGEHHDGHDFIKSAADSGASAVLSERENNYGLSSLIVDDSRTAITQLAGHWRNKFDIPVIVITGSNGKTTVKEMVAIILSEDACVHMTYDNLNNELGVPLTLLGLGEKHQYLVLEMGANHPGELKRLSYLSRPDIALITQCAPAHLAGFGGIDGVAKSKAEVFCGLVQDGVAVINLDDDYAQFWLNQTKNKRQITFSKRISGTVQAKEITLNNTGQCQFTLQIEQRAVPVKMNLLGFHSAMNALAAAACATGLGIDISVIKQGLERLNPVPGRLMTRTGIRGATLLDDTYNANPTSLQAALDMLSQYQGERWLVFGDMYELGDKTDTYHIAVGRYANDAGVERLWTIGEFSRQAQFEFEGEGAHFCDINRLIKTMQPMLSKKITVLIKGSRSMFLEQVVDGLLREL